MSAVPSRVSPSDFRSLLATDPNLVLLDVREPDEFAEGHIHGARNAPLGLLDPEALFADGTVFRNQPVYLVCRTSNRAAKAAAKFTAVGHAAPIVIDGGTLGWIAASLPVERGCAKGIFPTA